MIRQRKDHPGIPDGHRVILRGKGRSIIHVVEDTLAVFGEAEKLAGKALDKFLVICLIQIGFQRIVGLLIGLQFLQQAGFLSLLLIQSAVNLHRFHGHDDDQNGQNDQQDRAAAFLLGCHVSFLSGATGKAPAFS